MKKERESIDETLKFIENYSSVKCEERFDLLPISSFTIQISYENYSLIYYDIVVWKFQ